jgi:hypothetical protein
MLQTRGGVGRNAIDRTGVRVWFNNCLALNRASHLQITICYFNIPHMFVGLQPIFQRFPAPAFTRLAQHAADPALFGMRAARRKLLRLLRGGAMWIICQRWMALLASAA